MATRERVSRREMISAMAAGAIVASCGSTQRSQRDKASTQDAQAASAASAARTALLVAAAEAVIGLPIESAHYRRYIEWHAEHVPGHAEAYASLASELDRAARLEHRASYVDLALDQRTRIVDAVTLRHRVYDELFRGEVLLLYGSTDVWTHLGFPGWHGEPRGFAWIHKPLPTFEGA